MAKKRSKATTAMAPKLEGPRELVDPKTGEIVYIDQQVKTTVSKDSNFHKIWLANILQVLNIGNQKMDVVQYLLDEMNGQNMVIQTQREIAKGSKTSLSTVHRTLTALEEANFIKKKTGVIIISPKAVFKGTYGRRMAILEIWEAEDWSPSKEDKEKGTEVQSLKKEKADN